MYFQHAAPIWRDFPQLVPGALYLSGVTGTAEVRADRFYEMAAARLTGAAESELPEIQAWRRAFARMGLKPTQYRCASESLLRRFRKEGSLPTLHPLVDLCNAVSLAFAGDTEHPAPGEVIFADRAGHAHARRWTNRQSGRSAVRDTTAAALIVAEALHNQAPEDIPELITTLAAELEALWSVTPQAAVLTAASPRFTPNASGEWRGVQ